MDFSSSKIFYFSSDLIPVVAAEVAEELQVEGYEVTPEELLSGDVELALYKGGIFKSILGLKTALKVTFSGMGNRFRVDCKVGIWGQQAVPTAISMLFFWPVLITQIWGLVRQSRLDDHVLELVAEACERHGKKTEVPVAEAPTAVFCPQCGAQAKGAFCSACGAKL